MEAIVKNGHAAECAVFTVCNIAYLPKALVLAESLFKHDGLRLNIYLFDKKQTFKYPSSSANIIWIEDIGVPSWKQLAFLYDIIEFSTSLKPFIALQLLKTNRSVIFMDPDTCIFSTLSTVDELLDKHPIVLTPHYRKPQPSTEGESDLAMMRFGSFNLGFFAVNDTDEAYAFLRWWSDRCIAFSFMESQFGLSTDQKWVSIAPCFFPNLHVSFNAGLNAAPWNTFERQLSHSSAGGINVDGNCPLIFFHFSNFDVVDPQYLKKRASSEAGVEYPVLLAIAQIYAARLKFMAEQVDTVQYSFDYMSDGSYISPTFRRAYAAIRQELPADHDPFDSSGVVGNFGKRNNIVSKSTPKYTYPGLRDVQKHSLKMAFIYQAMRVILRIAGPNRFYDLSKLMVFLSIYRRNRGLWNK